MNLVLFHQYDFLTAWHLTDIGNLQSISTHGLMSRAATERLGIAVHEVGWKPIADQRSEWADYVLSFVTPHNKFTFGRIEYHHIQNKQSLGLALIEIDLMRVFDLHGGEALISNGLLSKKSMPKVVADIEHFEDTLDWHAMLDRSAIKTEDILFSRGAEILFPQTISASCIRSIWFPGAEHISMKLREIFGCNLENGERFFKNVGPLTSPARHNFTIKKRIGPTRIRHKTFGVGQIESQLGQRAVVNFEKTGMQLVRFGDYEWLDD